MVEKMTKNLLIKMTIFSVFLISGTADASAKIGLKKLTSYAKIVHKSSDSLAIFCCMMGISSFYAAKICWEKKEVQDGKETSSCKARVAGVMTAVGGAGLLLLSGTYFLNRYKIKRELNNILHFVST
jgi:hypothetical protein